MSMEPWPSSRHLDVHLQPLRLYRPRRTRISELSEQILHQGGYHSDDEARNHRLPDISRLPALTHAVVPDLPQWRMQTSITIRTQTIGRSSHAEAPGYLAIPQDRPRSSQSDLDSLRDSLNSESEERQALQYGLEAPAGRPRSNSHADLRSRNNALVDGLPYPSRRLDPSTAYISPRPLPLDPNTPINPRSDSAQSRRNSTLSSPGSRDTDSRASPLPASGVLGAGVYQYSPLLQKSDFRLVEILPKTMSVVKCKIIHASLLQPPDYTAISYAWGDPDEKCSIEIEQDDVDEVQSTVHTTNVIPVTVSLYDALDALRQQDKVVPAWIDGLCIDQQNYDERSQQVRLMPRIYEKATSMAIWLGPEADNSDLALRIVDEIANAAHTTGRISSVIESYARSSHFAYLASLFERKYWARLWVVQEVFLSDPETIRMYCGKNSRSWRTFKVASSALRKCQSTIEQYFPGYQDRYRHQRNSQSQLSFAQILATRGPNSLLDGSLRNLGQHPLLEIMRMCRSKHTAKPLDKVYGILGLLPEDVRKDFPVDYNSSVKALYIRVVDHVLSTTKRLDVLCESIHFPIHTGDYHLPTWCPDWYHMPAIRAIRDVANFTASKDHNAQCSFIGPRQLKLEIRAIYLGTVVEHGIALGTLTTSIDHLIAFLSWRALLLSKGNYRSDDELAELANIFCRTLCLGQIPQAYRDRDWKTLCYHVFASLLRDPNRGLPQLPLDEVLTQHASMTHIMASEQRRPFLKHFTDHMMGRRFCLLGDCRLMGLGSGFIGMHDLVVVPLGCPTPIVLRREGAGAEFRYVGDIYVEQYMHGLAVERWQSGRAELRTYVLH